MAFGVGFVVKRFNNHFFTISLGKMRLHNCLDPPESRSSRSGGRRQDISDLNRILPGSMRCESARQYVCFFFANLAAPLLPLSIVRSA